MDDTSAFDVEDLIFEVIRFSLDQSVQDILFSDKIQAYQRHDKKYFSTFCHFNVNHVVENVKSFNVEILLHVFEVNEVVIKMIIKVRNPTIHKRLVVTELNSIGDLSESVRITLGPKSEMRQWDTCLVSTELNLIDDLTESRSTPNTNQIYRLLKSLTNILTDHSFTFL